MERKRTGMPVVNREHLTKEQMAHRLGVTTKTIENMVARGSIPEPIRYSRKNIKWDLAEVLAWEAEIKKKEADELALIS